MLLRALAEAEPDPHAQATALLRWLGSGGVLGSGFPAYESVPEALLLQYPLVVLLGALEAAPQDEAVLAGAARLFAGWDFGQTRAADRAGLSAEWKQRLLACGLAAGDEDRLCRSRAARGGALARACQRSARDRATTECRHPAHRFRTGR